MNASTSSLVKRPPTPEPLILSADKLCSDNKRRTEGLSASDCSPAEGSTLVAAAVAGASLVTS